MTENYEKMWEELGLDLVAHDALLEVLGKGYQDIYLVQKNRPDGMGYFDFVMSEVHGLRIKELLDEKSAGRKLSNGRSQLEAPVDHRDFWRCYCRGRVLCGGTGVRVT